MNRLNKAIKLREDGKTEEAKELLNILLKKYPDNPEVNYQLAWCCDVLGLEREAVPYYVKAIKIGLSDTEMKDAYLGLDSTYRTIGEYEKSKQTFEDAIEKFDDNSLKVFYAMTLYNLENHSSSMEILLKIIAQISEDNSIRQYSKAIEFYSDKLDKIFD